ncbi:MAG: phage portal protein, partial [Armatimonadetes bacterium]|nr:phage portal protein [Armatimonadota bacterium]
AGKARVFQNGLKARVLGMNVKEAMLEEQRRYINERIAAICGVPLSLLNDLTHGTYANFEQQSLGYVVHNILPSVVEFEQVCNKALFVGNDADRFYVKVSLQGIVRGDFQTRMAGYEIGIRSGMWSPDECREWEDQDPIPAGLGEIHVMQAQMETLDTIANPPEPPPQLVAVPDSEDGSEDDSEVPEAIAADAAERIRIRAQIDADKKRDPEDTVAWARKILAPIAASYAAFDPEAFIAEAIGS